MFKANCEQDGKDLASEYKIRGYPTWVLMNSQKQTISRWLGYSKDHFIETLSTELTDLSPISEKESRYAEIPTLKDALALARYSSATGEYVKAVDYLKKAQELNPKEDYSYKILDNIIDGVRRDKFTYEDAVRAAEKVFAGNNVQQQAHAASWMSRLAKSTDCKDEEKKYLERGLAATAKANDDNLDGLATEFKIEYNLNFTGEKAKAVELKRSTYPEGWMDDANQLNSFAWWCYENDVNLEEAESLAVKAVNLSEPGRSKAMILDTAAHLCKSLGDMNGAVKYMEMAVTEDPDDEGWQKTLKEFKDEM